MSLKSEVFNLLNNVYRLCQDYQDTGLLAEALQKMRIRLETPLRVAVVGIMKAGKSTFLNALMGENILCTGTLETTYNVCWFRYAPTPSLTVYFRDNSQLSAEFTELKKWSVQECEAENPRINDVKYLIIHYPAEVLKTMEFIDTPGLNSIYGTDAQNTLDFLAIKGSEDTLCEIGMADAVIYAFSHTAKNFDQKILTSFHKGSKQTSSPINSIGLLTKVDATGIWNILSELRPTEIAEKVTNSVMENVDMKQLLFTILPICAKVYEGFIQMAPQDWKIIKNTAEIEPEELKNLLFDAEQFSNCTDEEYMFIGTPQARKKLMSLIGQYGILEISQQVRFNKSKEEIGTILQEACGVKAVRNLLLNHFGNRTFLIKTQYIFNHLNDLIHKIRNSSALSFEMKEICRQLSEGIEKLMVSVQTLKELKALQMYYSGQLQFMDNEEKQEFLRATGEYGRCAENRLGVATDISLTEMAKLAQQKVALWHSKANTGWMLSNAYIEAAFTIARTYEQIYYHLNALIEE